MPAAKTTSTITEVWTSNVEQEINRISSLIGDHNHVALDTEFPGVVMRLVSNDNTSSIITTTDSTYQVIRQNVNILKLIQLGLTISNSDAIANDHNYIPETWQFNFSFSLSNDMYSDDSINLLQKSGVDFIAHEKNGIDPIVFADLITTSGLLCNDAIQWITFHGSYDFAYLLKTLVGKNLPKSQNEFFRWLHVLFPKRHDLKCLIRNKHSTITDSSFLNRTKTTTTSTTANTNSPDNNNNNNNNNNNSDNNNNLDNLNGQPIDNISNSNNVTPTKTPNDTKSIDDANDDNNNATSPKEKQNQKQDERSKRPLYGGLNRIAQLMGCQRIGMKHQAGSDSLLTLDVYFRVRDDVLHGEIDAADDGRIYGLGGGLFH